MSKLCILTITTSIMSVGLMFYHQMYGFESFSSKTVNEAVNSFWSSQWSKGQVINITQINIDLNQVAKNATSERSLDRVRKHFQSKLKNLEQACSRYHTSSSEVQVKLQTFSLEPKSRSVFSRQRSAVNHVVQINSNSS